LGAAGDLLYITIREQLIKHFETSWQSAASWRVPIGCSLQIRKQDFADFEPQES